MPFLSRRDAGRDTADTLHRLPRTSRTAIEPMLPVVVSSALFIATLAIPFVAALLVQ
jgi:hypothetical protein